MLNSVIVGTVEFCTRRARAVVIAALALAIAAGVYTARHFTIDTNINNLLSADLPWRQHQLQFQAAFPQTKELLLVVVDAPTLESADVATEKLTHALQNRADAIRSAQEIGGGAFFRTNGLLFRPEEQVAKSMQQLTKAKPLLRVLAEDPSLRGVLKALSLTMQGVEEQLLALDDLAGLLKRAADTVESVLAGRRADFSWRAFLQANADQASPPRRLIAVRPILDTADLAPGRKAAEAIRQTAGSLGLSSAYGANIRLTGPVPIADEEFSSVRQGLFLNSTITGALVLAILWLALRSVRLVLAVVVTLAVGLIVTAALGIVLVGGFNPISLAFAVLFVGLGADFAIQFGVRYRAQRHQSHQLDESLAEAAERIGAPLTLAAAAAAAGFLSFSPTSYAGLAQLGKIAGAGMIVAYAASLTLLPALIAMVNPPGEPRTLRQPALAPVDSFLKRHRYKVLFLTAALTVAGLPALVNLQFDFNPLNLRSAETEATATLLDLRSDPAIGSKTAQVLAASHADAITIAKKLAALPEVETVRSVDTFIPVEQDKKLPLIRAAAEVLEPILGKPQRPAPSDTENVSALASRAQELRDLAQGQNGAGAEAAVRLADELVALAGGSADLRAGATRAFVEPLTQDLADLRGLLRPEPVTRDSLPEKLVADWVAADGQERVEAIPKGDSNDNATLQKFARAVLSVEPTATGQAIETLAWGETIIRAFLEAAGWALLAISLLLWIVLRRVGDVLLTLVPLVVAALMTLEICAMSGFALNHANIIALPVLLGVGVAFKIYYIMAWRRGQTDFLQSALTRAVFFSALLTATAFGSLWLSTHPGTSTMGKLLALSLACTLVSAVLFQPALMGEPRRENEARPT